MTRTWKIAVVSAATAVGATTAVVALTDRTAAPVSATVPPDTEGGEGSDRPERSVAVTGRGTVKVQPDIAELFLGVSITSPDAAAVYSTLETESTALVESLKGLGLAAEDLQTSGLNIYPNIDESQISSFVGSVDVRATVRDLARIGEIIDGVQGFVGAELTLNGISFSYAEPETVLGEARAAAVDNARTRAEQYAEAAGGGVGEVLEIIEGSVPSTFLPRTAFDDAGGGAAAEIAIEPGSQELAVDVTVVFELT